MYVRMCLNDIHSCIEVLKHFDDTAILNLVSLPRESVSSITDCMYVSMCVCVYVRALMLIDIVSFIEVLTQLHRSISYHINQNPTYSFAL